MSRSIKSTWLSCKSRPSSQSKMNAAQKQRKGVRTTSKFSPRSGVISFKTIETGAANAENGENATNYDHITNKPDISFDPYNKA